MTSRRWVPLLAASVALAGCEAVSGLSSLEFVPEDEEPCVSEPIDAACADVACGETTDNCGISVACPDTCAAPLTCGGGGVEPNTCGCTGAPNLTPEPPPECGIVAVGDPATTGTSGNTYFVCGGASFEGARAFCQGIGMDLVVLSSGEEAVFVRDLVAGVLPVPSNAWIGLFDPDGCLMGEPCDFVWVDGSPLGFSLWAAGEPNNTGGGEHCAELNFQTGQWNDVPCSNSRVVVCETTCPSTL